MKKFLIIYANPNPKSFCGSIKNITIEKLKKMKHEVLLTDLYSIKFNPVASPSDLKKLKNSENFQLMSEQIFSYEFENNFDNYKKEIKDELDKITWADNLIFIFPIWWGSYPAILKGWFDKCLVFGHSWTNVNTFSNGLLKGKTAWGVVTCEDTKENYSKEGLQKTTIEDMLHHFNRGTMSFVGAKVLKTYCFYQLGKLSNKEREDELIKYEKVLENFDSIETLYE
jgi:NAD(P)H dehydrogenase (quinone)